MAPSGANSDTKPLRDAIDDYGTNGGKAAYQTVSPQTTGNRDGDEEHDFSAERKLKRRVDLVSAPLLASSAVSICSTVASFPLPRSHLCLRSRSDGQSIFDLNLHLHCKQHNLPATVHDYPAFDRTSPLLCNHYYLLWHHHSLHRFHHKMAPDDRIARPSWHLQVWDLPWIESSHQHLVHAQRTATSLLSSSQAKSSYWPLDPL